MRQRVRADIQEAKLLLESGIVVHDAGLGLKESVIAARVKYEFVQSDLHPEHVKQT